MNPPTAAIPLVITADTGSPVAAPASRAAESTGVRPTYRRILLKLSGEALMGEDAYGINRQVIDRIVAEIGEVVELGVQVAVVIGGGNLFRGVAPGAAGMDCHRRLHGHAGDIDERTGWRRAAVPASNRG
jgi:hypothetical protein